MSLPTNFSEGTLVSIHRSNDGSSWRRSTPDLECVVQSDKNCTFTTDHLSYFALAEEVDDNDSSNPKRKPDVCKNGDHSKSRYDKKCFDENKTTELKVTKDIVKDISSTKRQGMQYDYVWEDVPFSVFVPSVKDARIGKLLEAIHQAMISKIFVRINTEAKLEKLLTVYESLLLDIAKTYDLKTMGKKAFGESVSSFAKVLGEIKK